MIKVANTETFLVKKRKKCKYLFVVIEFQNWKFSLFD